jgi:hypothetical protein
MPRRHEPQPLRDCHGARGIAPALPNPLAVIEARRAAVSPIWMEAIANPSSQVIVQKWETTLKRRERERESVEESGIKEKDVLGIN